MEELPKIPQSQTFNEMLKTLTPPEGVRNSYSEIPPDEDT